MYSPAQSTETKVAILEEKINSSDQLLSKIENELEKYLVPVGKFYSQTKTEFKCTLLVWSPKKI